MTSPVSSIPNLGPASEAAFAVAGITSAEEIRALGPDEAYARLLRSGTRPHFIGYYVLAMGLLRSSGDFSAHIVEVNRLENEGDRVSREAVASLFDAGIDPMVVIRWKDIFERLEDGIDATERTANVLEGIRIKKQG